MEQAFLADVDAADGVAVDLGSFDASPD